MIVPRTRQRRSGARRFIGAILAGMLVINVAEVWSEPTLPDYADYSDVLKTFADDRGIVDYGKLKANRQKLDAFARTLAAVDPQQYESWSQRDKIAFWINAYNALTLKAIVDHYPIMPGFLQSLRFPRNSIRQIPGVWDKLRFTVMGRKRTLDEIEHDILRTRFSEPRIHMALVCAAMGCPPLRQEPYTGSQLEAQLDDQTRRFLGNPDKFRIDRDRARVYFSPIFKWFAKDFAKNFSTDKFSRHTESEASVLQFVHSYLPPTDRAYLEQGDYGISYLPYDWSLNERDATALK